MDRFLNNYAFNFKYTLEIASKNQMLQKVSNRNILFLALPHVSITLLKIATNAHFVFESCHTYKQSIRGKQRNASRSAHKINMNKNGSGARVAPMHFSWHSNDTATETNFVFACSTLFCTAAIAKHYTARKQSYPNEPNAKPTDCEDGVVVAGWISFKIHEQIEYTECDRISMEKHRNRLASFRAFRLASLQLSGAGRIHGWSHGVAWVKRMEENWSSFVVSSFISVYIVVVVEWGNQRSHIPFGAMLIRMMFPDRGR